MRHSIRRTHVQRVRYFPEKKKLSRNSRTGQSHSIHLGRCRLMALAPTTKKRTSQSAPKNDEAPDKATKAPRAVPRQQRAPQTVLETRRLKRRSSIKVPGLVRPPKASYPFIHSARLVEGNAFDPGKRFVSFTRSFHSFNISAVHPFWLFKEERQLANSLAASLLPFARLTLNRRRATCYCSPRSGR